jgi:peptidoglycan-N-acetylglucosamine deacetylase
MPAEAAWQEMADGIASVTKALGNGRMIAPFVRFPALNRTGDLELRAMADGLMVWSTDIYADDWMHITPEEVSRRPLERLQQAGKGIVLFHDIQARTVAALPEFIKGLKQNGFRVVHVVAASGTNKKTMTSNADWHAIDHALLSLPAKMQQIDHPQ